MLKYSDDITQSIWLNVADRPKSAAAVGVRGADSDALK